MYYKIYLQQVKEDESLLRMESSKIDSEERMVDILTGMIQAVLIGDRHVVIQVRKYLDQNDWEQVKRITIEQ